MDPLIAQPEPYAFKVTKDKRYAWCACGLSQEQPLCDGSHRETDILPIMYKAVADETVYFCGCKQSSNQPLCDGTHNLLVDEIT